jgi:hypothetical protein
MTLRKIEEILPEQKEEYVSAFSSFATEGNSLSSDELGAALSSLGISDVVSPPPSPPLFPRNETDESVSSRWRGSRRWKKEGQSGSKSLWTSWYVPLTSFVG